MQLFDSNALITCIQDAVRKEMKTIFREEKILASLNNEPVQIDKIAALTNLSTSDCLVHLLSLEFKGLIKQLPGKVFALL